MLNKADYERFFWSVEDKHFWFKGRQDFIKKAIPTGSVKILDIGCASGGNLKSLDSYELYGLDLSLDAVREARKRGLKNVIVADAVKFPFKDEEFDFVFCSDLLEHVEKDDLVLKEIYRILKKNGRAIIGVPAFDCLWTEFDEINNHFRRYTRRRLLELIKKTDFKIKRFSFWNFSIFLPVLIIRFLRRIKLLKHTKYDIEIPGKFINNLMIKILKIENSLIIRGFKFPFGVSLVAVLEK